MIFDRSFRPTLILLSLLAVGTACGNVSLAAPPSYAAEVLSDNPFLYYRFGESTGDVAADAGASAMDGTYVNSPLLGTTGGGLGSDDAVAFSRGSSQYLATPDAAKPFSSFLGNSTYEFVFSGTNTDNRIMLYGSANDGLTTNSHVSINDGEPGRFRFYIRDDSGKIIGGYFDDATLLDGSHHHLLWTYDQTGAELTDRLKAYADGMPQELLFNGGSQAPSNFSSEFNYAPYFGAMNLRGSLYSPFDGVIDEAALYTTVLTEQEVLNRAQALGVGVPEPTSVLLLLLGACGYLVTRRRV
ncbi:LamG-like jellyroll fold domain-containing protein [Aeoliella mucimassa]|uniref:PEP-CTERM protein-sorting domain-containing protein n=1 Tax=Aeoliella mucimassa TaxID=2527972 RepID=A0A518AJY0_9BACT|nr:LamG-like jellyroll fold domain-containing protein [Aeoliella mucimassa]QDU55029.1 hypothetical protein Pan181_12150 [Aeoliella mucimassa]